MVREVITLLSSAVLISSVSGSINMTLSAALHPASPSGSPNSLASGAPQCDWPLGMQSGDIDDTQLSASTSFDPISLGAASARIRTDYEGGAWCPSGLIAENSYEWVQVTFGARMAKRITAIETQGRYAQGTGLEYASQYRLEYKRPGCEQWIRYVDEKGEELFVGNSDTNTPVYHALVPPIPSASHLRVVPFALYQRTVCMRIEVYGCQVQEPPVSYWAPRGAPWGPLDLTDRSYTRCNGSTHNGQSVNDENSAGWGQLTDGLIGDARVLNLVTAVDDGGQGATAGGWQNDVLRPESRWVSWQTYENSGPLEIAFHFPAMVRMEHMRVHMLGAAAAGIHVCKLVRLKAGVLIDGQVDGGKAVRFGHQPNVLVDVRSEQSGVFDRDGAHWLQLNIPDLVGNLLDFHCIAEPGRIFISDVQFTTKTLIEDSLESDRKAASNQTDLYLAAAIGIGIACLLACTLFTTLLYCVRARRELKGDKNGASRSKSLGVKGGTCAPLPDYFNKGCNNGDMVYTKASLDGSGGTMHTVASNGAVSANTTSHQPNMFTLADSREHLKPTNNSSTNVRAKGQVRSAHASPARLPLAARLIMTADGKLCMLGSNPEGMHQHAATLGRPHHQHGHPHNSFGPPPLTSHSQRLFDEAGYAVPSELDEELSETQPMLRGLDAQRAMVGGRGLRMSSLPPMPTMGVSATHACANPTPTTSCSSGYSGSPSLIRKSVPELDRCRLVPNNLLGSGQFGQVHIGTLVSNDLGGTSQRLVAVKMLRVNVDHQAKQWFLSELELLARLDHAHVLKVLGACTKEEPLCMVLEYCDKGDLCQFLAPKIGTLDAMFLLGVSVQIAAGMRYLESVRLAHRDLAARNCFVSSMQDDDMNDRSMDQPGIMAAQQHLIQIGDLGMTSSDYCHHYWPVPEEVGQNISAAAGYVLPVRWMAPEAISQGEFTTKSDVWSFGVTIWEVFNQCASLPLSELSNEGVVHNAMAIAGSMDHAVLPERPPLCHTDLYQLMLECWRPEPHRRPTFASVHRCLSQWLSR